MADEVMSSVIVAENLEPKFFMVQVVESAVVAGANLGRSLVMGDELFGFRAPFTTRPGNTNSVSCS